MGEQTAIGWTDHTFNPWWGCTRVSPGCNNCYAETFAKRTGHRVWGTAPRRFFAASHWEQPLKWDRAARAAGRQELVFCASMADVFEDHPELDHERTVLWDLIAATPNLIWQLLTKRPQNALRMAPDWWWTADEPNKYPNNVWIGTSVEDQQRADERIPPLLEIPAVVRFLSCEPLLGPVEFLSVGGAACTVGGIDWVIAGGESGAHHRPLDLGHARGLRDQCLAANVPFFFKQVGGRWPTERGDLLDGHTYHAFPPVYAAADSRRIGAHTSTTSPPATVGALGNRPTPASRGLAVATEADDA